MASRLEDEDSVLGPSEDYFFAGGPNDSSYTTVSSISMTSSDMSTVHCLGPVGCLAQSKLFCKTYNCGI